MEQLLQIPGFIWLMILASISLLTISINGIKHERKKK